MVLKEKSKEKLNSGPASDLHLDNDTKINFLLGAGSGQRGSQSSHFYLFLLSKAMTFKLETGCSVVSKPGSHGSDPVLSHPSALQDSSFLGTLWWLSTSHRKEPGQRTGKLQMT